MHGGEHWHVHSRRTGELLGRLTRRGKILPGSKGIPKTALNIFKKLRVAGKLGGAAVTIWLELAFPEEVGADMLPVNYDNTIKKQIQRDIFDQQYTDPCR